MQVTETLSQGLKREYAVVVPASDLATRLDAQLADMKTKVQINGFRPGKVPVAHLKRVYGRSVMADVVQETIAAAHKQIIDESGLRLAQEPKVELPTDKDAIDAALEARGDFAFTMALEVLPKFEIGDYSDITLERPVAEISESEIDDGVQRLAKDRRVYTDKAAGAKAEKFDRVTVDFVGTIDGERFEGGTSENIEVLIGSNTFIPGFEDELIGAIAGEPRKVEATFPEAYATRSLAGRRAQFDVSVKAVAAPEPIVIDDEFAKTYGEENVETLRAKVRETIAKEYGRASRERVKRKLLDALAERYAFEVPEGLVEQEFSAIWTQVEREQKASGRSFAVRRVRLGLLLAEIGAKAGISITDEEMTQALVAQARAFPGQEQKVWDFYRNNQEALAQLRAPIYEEKVVDHILGVAKVEDRKVTVKELLADEEESVPAA
jgi:trigger factor